MDFPICGSGRTIPWSVAEKAHEEYVKRYGKIQTLKRIAERGGFYTEEMDTLYPQWREQSDEIYMVKNANATLAAENASLRDALSRLVEAVQFQRECRGVEFDLTIDEPFRTHAIYEIVQSNIAAGDEITQALSAAEDAMKDCG